jgi:hypothetical protein
MRAVIRPTGGRWGVWRAAWLNALHFTYCPTCGLRGEALLTILSFGVGLYFVLPNDPPDVPFALAMRLVANERVWGWVLVVASVVKAVGFVFGMGRTRWVASLALTCSWIFLWSAFLLLDTWYVAGVVTGVIAVGQVITSTRISRSAMPWNSRRSPTPPSLPP